MRRLGMRSSLLSAHLALIATVDEGPATALALE